MLFTKPLLLKREHEAKKQEREKRGGDFEMVESSSDVSSKDIEDYNKIEMTDMQLENIPNSIPQENEQRSLLSPKAPSEQP